MSDFQLQRLGQIMEPEAGNPHEVEGVLNPAAARGPDGHLYLFPRLVAQGNYSHIGMARVRFDQAGEPCGVERLGIALEPETDYERRADGTGGCEDPRITFMERIQRYVMTYTALSPIGPRIALAISEDLFHWRRLGLAPFAPYHGIDFVHVDNKDACLFPVAMPNHAGKMQTAILHRPLFPGTRPEETACKRSHRVMDRDRESIWISYCPVTPDGLQPLHPALFNSHLRLASPVSPWEALKIGVGTPPMLTRHGWLILYHGVSELSEPGSDPHRLCYSAGVMVLAKEHPRVIRYRSAQPVLTPLLSAERHGSVPNVVFPTGIDRRDDIGQPDRFDVYYGMADAHHVHLLTYILAADATGERVTSALSSAARRGVQCRLMADAVGSRAGLDRWEAQLRRDGVEVIAMLQVGFFRHNAARFDLRNHRKLAVIDGRIGYVGSQNIINPEFVPGYPNEELMARVTGPVVAQIQAVLLADGFIETGATFDFAPLFPELPATGTSAAQLLPSGPGYQRENAEELFIALLYAARQRVVITTPYFVPDEPFLSALRSAARRGVEVRLIVSLHANQPFTQLAQRSYYDDLLAAGSTSISIDRAFSTRNTSAWTTPSRSSDQRTSTSAPLRSIPKSASSFMILRSSLNSTQCRRVISWKARFSIWPHGVSAHSRNESCKISPASRTRCSERP